MGKKLVSVHTPGRDTTNSIPANLKYTHKLASINGHEVITWTMYSQNVKSY